MKAVWSYRFTLTDGRTLEADVVRTRTTPYTQVQVDLYSKTEAVRLMSRRYPSQPQALLAVSRAVAKRGLVLDETPVALRGYEPEDTALLFSHTREQVARWWTAARVRGSEPLAPDAEWSEIGQRLEAVDIKTLRANSSEALVDAHWVLLDIVEKLTDILIWQLRQQRAIMLNPSITPRQAYIRSAHSVVANLETLRHLAPHYAVTPRTTTIAEVIDMFAWKRARSRAG